MKAELVLDIPPTLNEQIREARSHWSVSAQTKKRWTVKVALLAHSLPRFPDKVWLDYLWLVKSKANDPDNLEASVKFIADGLVMAGVITKDSLMIIQSPVVHRFDKGVDTVVITIADSPIWKLERIEQESQWIGRDMFVPSTIPQRAKTVNGRTID